jgi:uncharacterized membrane protein YfcA
MKDTMVLSKKVLLPLKINTHEVKWLVVGGGTKAFDSITQLLGYSHKFSITVVAEEIDASVKRVAERHHSVKLVEKGYEPGDLSKFNMIIIATDNKILDEKIQAEAKQHNVLVFLPANSQISDFAIAGKEEVEHTLNNQWFQRNTDKPWKNLATKLIWGFVLMVVGYIIISYLPLPPWSETWRDIKPFFDYKFLFFVVAGFLAQMVDGMLSMGYGVTSATCLMSFGVSPVSVSAAIHTSEIFTTGVSGYSHYKFGNVNKKLFKHLVIPGVIGAVLGALMLVFLGEKYGNYLMPAIALYAGFLGLKILIKAFQGQPKTKKIKRLGWLAGLGGFFDSFGGGGWGPIVTSSLISKGRSPKYTVGSVSLTEFFVTLSSAFTFFITVGVSHWNVVLGLLIGGSIAAPIAARFAGKLPRKTMMILVGIMVMIWCVRMFIKSVF